MELVCLLDGSNLYFIRGFPTINKHSFSEYSSANNVIKIIFSLEILIEMLIEKNVLDVCIWVVPACFDRFSF